MGKLCRLKSLDVVKNEANERGFVFLSEHYLGSHATKYMYQCNVCNKVYKKWHPDFLNMVPCNHIQKKSPPEEALDRGFILLDSFVRVVGINYRYQCVLCNNITVTNHHEFKRLKSCSFCRKEKGKKEKEKKEKKEKKKKEKKEKITKEKIFAQRKKSIKYTIVEDNEDTVLVRCWKNHYFAIDLNKALVDQTCKQCKHLNRKKTREEIEAILHEHNYSLEGVYINTASYFRIKCPEGHIYPTLINDFKRGYRCKECQKRKTSDVALEVETQGFILKSEYLGYHNDVMLCCKICGNSFTTTYDNFRKGSACRFCYGSNLEKPVTTFLRELGVDFLSRDHTPENPVKNSWMRL